MKLFDKIKDLFMDEVTEDEEVELEEEENKYIEPPKDVLPKVMRETIKKEEKNIQNESSSVTTEKETNKSLEKNNESEKKFSFPIDFDDELPQRNNKQKQNVNVLNLEKETPKKVSELYSKKEEIKAKPKFKATPVISPVYGILDKNYKKDEVKEKAEDTSAMKRPSRKVDFETVRKKAFGNLADDIKDNMMCENCELYKEVKKISSLSEDDLLYDMTLEEEKPLTIEKAYEDYEEFGVAYQPEIKEKENKTLEIDDNINDKVEIENHEKANEHEEEIIPSRSEKVEKKKETKVDDDFFELIDSMYKERVDE